MKEDQEGSLHVCRVCSKEFSSGRVLGGHMRSHLILSSRREESELKKSDSPVIQSGYSLRECPKKSWKSSSYGNTCEICGKEFDSRRALFGHMRHHSLKGRNQCTECGKVFQSLKSLTNHMRTHTAENVRVSELSLMEQKSAEPTNLRFVRRKRSKRFRCNAIASSSSISSLNGSSSVTELDDAEEVALCLMMLSRGVKNWSRGSEVGSDGFSRDDSVDFEARSPNQNKRLMNERDDQSLKKRRTEVDHGVVDSFGIPMDHEVGSWTDAQEKREEVDELRLNATGSGSDCKHCRAPEIWPDSSIAYYDCVDLENKNEYKCRTCDKIFQSYQALGGHQTLHRTSRTSAEETEGVEYFGDEEVATCLKEHQCVVCLKVFGSGQALGGHKKIHHGKSRQEKQQAGCDRSSSQLDLNFPASSREGAAVVATSVAVG